MSFDKLLAELDDLQKAMPACDDSEGDEKIEAAAKEGDEAEDDEEGEGATDAKPMGKSFSFETADGEKIEAIDATEMLKSLGDRLEAREAQDESLQKTLQKAVELIGTQAAMLKSLQAKVDKLSAQGRGRVSTIVADKPADMQKAMGGDPGWSKGDLLAKALSAQKEGRLTVGDVAMVEASINHGMAPPPEIVSRFS